jgi:hypothetical protein
LGTYDSPGTGCVGTTKKKSGLPKTVKRNFGSDLCHCLLLLVGLSHSYLRI